MVLVEHFLKDGSLTQVLMGISNTNRKLLEHEQATLIENSTQELDVLVVIQHIVMEMVDGLIQLNHFNI